MAFGTLSIIYPDRRQQTIVLTKSPLRMGRADDNDLVVNDPSVSRYHAQLVCDGSGCHVTDLGSANGTLLAGVRLTPNAPQPVRDGAQVQLGNVVLHFRSVAVHAAATVAAPAPQPVPQGAFSGTPPGNAAPPPQAAPVRVILNPTQVTLEAGGAGVVTLQIINTGTVVDHYTVQVDGWNEAWLVTAPARLPLLPDAEGNMVLTFRPPRTSEAYAQQGSVTITVWSEHQRGTVFSTQLPLTILPFRDFALDADPNRAITRRRATYGVTIHNRGNSTQTFALSAQDDAHRVQCAFEQPTLTVGPGQRAQTRLHAHALQRPLSGSPHMYTIEITATPTDAGGSNLGGSVMPVQAQSTAQVQLVQNARLPVWAIPMALAAMMFLCGGAAFAGKAFLDRNQAAALAQAAAAQQAGIAATQAALQAEQNELLRQAQQGSEQQQREALTALAQNSQQQTAIAQTAQALATTQTAIAAAQTAQAAATQTAQAQANATPTITPPPSGGVTPPVLDGVFGDAEWRDRQPIGEPLSFGSVVFMNDADNLYLLLDITEDTVDDALGAGARDIDFFQLAFDVDGSRQLESGVDLLYALDSGTGRLVVTRDFDQNTNAGFSAGQVAPGFDSSPNARTPHRIWELAIPLRELGVRPGQPVGMSVGISSLQPPLQFEEPLGALSFTLAQPQ